MRSSFDNRGGVGYRQDTVAGLIEKVHRHRPAVSLSGVDVVGIRETNIRLPGRNHPDGRAVTGDDPHIVGLERFEDLSRAVRAIMGEPTRHVPAGGAELGRGHDQPALPLAFENVLDRFGSVFGRDSLHTVSNHPRSKGEAVPSAVRIGIRRRPVVRRITAVRSQKVLARQAYRVEYLARPEDVGNRRGRLGLYPLNKPDGLACFGVKSGQDVDPGLSLEFGDDRLSYLLIHRTVKNDFSADLVRILPARQERRDQQDG